jgi:hypothetical protein
VVASDIRKDLGAYSEEAVKVPIVPPPDAKSTVNEVEKKLTFQETLAKKEPTPVPLVRAAQKDNTVSPGGEAARASGARKYVVQAGAFREKRTAEAYRKRLDKAGGPGVEEKRGEVLPRAGGAVPRHRGGEKSGAEAQGRDEDRRLHDPGVKRDEDLSDERGV